MACFKCGNSQDIEEEFLVISQSMEYQGQNGQIERTAYSEAIRGMEREGVCRSCLEKFRRENNPGLGFTWILCLSVFVFAVTSVVLLLEAHSFQWIGLVISFGAALLTAGVLVFCDLVHKKRMPEPEVLSLMLHQYNEEKNRMARAEGFGHLAKDSYYYFPAKISYYMKNGKFQSAKLNKLKSDMRLELHTDLQKYIESTLID